MENMIIQILIFSFGLFIVGLFAIYRGIKEFKLIQKIENIPTSTIRSVAVGLVELKGVVKKKKYLKSPISKRHCVYWEIHLYEHDGEFGWREFDRIHSNEEFYIKDSTGKISINPKNSQTKIKKVKEEKITTLNGIRDIINNLEKHKKQEFEDIIIENKLIKLEEYLIEKDEEIYVLGSAKIHKKKLIVGFGEEKILNIRNGKEKNILEKLRDEMKWNVYGGVILSSITLLIFLLTILFGV